MKTKDIERVIVTGGVGFIDSHLIDNIITQDTHVTVFDNLTGGTLQNIKQWLNNLLHAQSIRRWLDSYNFGATDFDYTTGSKHQKQAL